MATSWLRSNYGAGAQDGTSYANAYNGDTAANFDIALTDAGSGGQVYIVGQASYPSVGTMGAALFNYSVSEAGCRITGVLDDGGTTVATGSNRPVITGNWLLANFSGATGITFLTAANSVNGVYAEALITRNFRRHYYFFNYQNDDITLDNIDFREGQDGIWIRGLAAITGATTSLEASNNIIIANFSGVNFTKRGIRFDHGCYNATVSSGTIDVGGLTYAKEVFQICVEGGNASTDSADHDITLRNVEVRNAYNDNGSGYWNSDGFSFEDNTFNISFYSCRAYDNTDGGWDLKWNSTLGSPPYLQDCVGIGNARQMRFHTISNGYATVVRSFLGYGMLSGGSGSACGLWAQGNVNCSNSTFHNNTDSGANSAQIVLENNAGGANANITNCIVSQLSDNASGVIISMEANCNVNSSATIGALSNFGTVIWNQNTIDTLWAEGIDPQYQAEDNINYNTSDNSFNPELYKSGVTYLTGYFNALTTSQFIAVPISVSGVNFSGVSFL